MIREGGQIIVVVIAALGVVLFSVLFIIAGSQLYFQNASYTLDAEMATSLAEAGVDKALQSINRTGGSYSGESETSLGKGSYSVTVTAQDAANKLVESTGFVPNKANPRAKRTIKITVSRGVGASFVYGIQVGEGGLELGNSNIITGSVYSNGSITGGNGNKITGDVWVAGGPQADADRETDCEGSNCSDFIFGTTVAGQSQLDVAQSFKPAVAEVLNRIFIKVKRIGSVQAPDATVRILKDKSGEPDKNQVLATGTLYRNLTSDVNYGWIEVTFDSLPALTAGTTYWLMVDVSYSAANYWTWQADLAKSYACGTPDTCIAKWSPDWKAGNSVWTLINADLSFKTFMGGAPTSVDGGVGKGINVKKDASGNGGSVHANTIRNITMEADAYYKTIDNSEAANFYPNSDDPPPKSFPLSDVNVSDWQRQAGACDSQGNNCQNEVVGDITTCISVLESKKYVGNVTFGSNCNVTVKSPVWITGNLTFNSGNILRLDPAYGETSGVIVVGTDTGGGIVTLGSNNRLEGTGSGSSILMVLSTYDSQTSGTSAIVITNIGNSGVFYASRGIIEPGNHNTFKELTAWGIKLVNNGTIDYTTGLSSTLFTSGPTGSYSLVKGTYQVK
ncbi:hypothetical protein HYT18_04660 [Candidatus Microgenomates bacterium]|nr:hypothetical protein [Candidatus Microgenomates bacterium]